MAKMAKRGGKDKEQYAPAITDERFARLHTDPRFLRPNRDEAKVVVDDRFKGLLTGGGAGKKGKKMDKYGRKIDEKAKAAEEEEMKRLYRLEQQEGDGETESSTSGSRGASGSDEEDEEHPVDGGEFIDYARGEGQMDSSDDDSSSSEDDEASSSEEGTGEVTIGTASARRKEKQRLRFADDANESDEAEIPEEEDLDVDEDDLAELDAVAEKTVQEEAATAKKRREYARSKRNGDTSRLAAVNMDWDHIRALDLYKVFSSLVSPAGRDVASSSHASKDVAARPSSQIVAVKGRVLNVRVYPSNFGLGKMALENREGPPKEIFKHDEDGRVKLRRKQKKKKARSRDDGSDDSGEELFEVDEGGEFDEEALRNYQLERLRYYYAIITFDRPETARYIMDEIDGTEMERTANIFDLSFVPDDMTFPDHQASKEDLSDEGWRDEATEMHNEGSYKGLDFTTDALRHSKVKLTWDADDPQRSKITRQLAQQPLTVDALRDEDFKAYLASDSEPSDEEEEGGNEEERAKMRSLLGLNGDDSALETNTGFGKSKSVAFEDGRKTRSGQGEEGGEGREMQITFMPGLSEAAERKKKGITAQTTQEETTRDKYLRKQKEKKERKKAQNGGVVGGEEVEGEERSEETGRIGFDDPFFASDNEIDFEEALAAEQEGRDSRGKPQKAKKEAKKQNIREATPDETTSLIDAGSDADDATGHFNIKDVLKAEQEEKGKKNRWAKKKEKKNKAKEAGREEEVQENFAIDVADERFQGVFDDHRFALDPSHPSFIKTKNMGKLLDERRKRDKQRNKEASSETNGESMGRNGGHVDLADLVQSVKKRSFVDKPNGRGDGHQRKRKIQRT